ncbi:MAG: cyclopropane fatty-acyl-phospholipid synthase-like methyltransferase [Oceanicoccus sp.]|jgi:cyclopropane fatty-acyl-phospholipid synthase-like methyltransferase
MERPFSQACENNKAAILEVITPYFSAVAKVLEVGSGTAQHAVYFAEQMPHLIWQTADREEYIPAIESWREWAGLDNLPPPLCLDVNQPWPLASTPAIFSANTAHIMSWQEVELFFQGIAGVLAEGGIFCLYGPFNYGGQFSSDSNARFELWLKDRNPDSGIRDFEAVNALAEKSGLTLLADHEMPANNRCLVWQRK